MLGDFEHVVVATGITPRVPDIEGINHEKAVSYIDVLKGNKPVGKRVAIMGAGGIGFDVADTISHDGPSGALDKAVFRQRMGRGF